MQTILGILCLELVDKIKRFRREAVSEAKGLGECGGVLGDQSKDLFLLSPGKSEFL